MYPFSRARFSRAPGTRLVPPPYLEWVSSTGASIAFDGIKYAMMRSGAFEGFSGSTAEVIADTHLEAIGEIYRRVKYTRRIVSFRAVAFGDNRAELEHRREDVTRALNPYGGQGRLYWRREDGTTRYLVCSVSVGYPKFLDGTKAKTNAKIWYFDVEFIAPDPCWYANDVITKSLGIWFTNPGDMPCPCTINIGSPPGTSNYRIQCKSGEFIKSEIPMNGLVIDTTPGNISVMRGDSNEMWTISLDSTFFQVLPGDFWVTGADGVVSFRPRWMGV